MEKRGVYFLANDKVFELAIAFLNSFRTYNNDIPLCLIPYDDECFRLFDLKLKYKFIIFDDRHILEQLDQISIELHDRCLGAYRKLAAWCGEFEEFIYIDVDTVILGNLKFVFRLLGSYDFLASHSNRPWIVKWVWKESIRDANVLNEKQIKYAANTGFMASRRSTLSIEDMHGKLKSALSIKKHMVLRCMEQSYINYLIVDSGCKYGSLLSIYDEGDEKDVKLELWAGSRGGFFIFNRFIHVRFFPLIRITPVLLVHWAGLWQAVEGNSGRLPYGRLWKYYRNNFPDMALQGRVS